MFGGAAGGETETRAGVLEGAAGSLGGKADGSLYDVGGAGASEATWRGAASRPEFRHQTPTANKTATTTATVITYFLDILQL